MKKLFLSAALALGLFAISASFDSAQDDNINEPKVQCGVSNADIASYLQNCSHHHTVYSVSDIRGTCNSSAAIEFNGTATVYVQDGFIVFHADSNINPPQ